MMISKVLNETLYVPFIKRPGHDWVVPGDLFSNVSDAMNECVDWPEADFFILRIDPDGFKSDVTEDALTERNKLLISRGDGPVFATFYERENFASEYAA